MYDNLLDSSRSEVSTVTNQKRGSSGRIIRSLFKKSFLIKIRRPASILEFLFACIVWMILIPTWKLGRVKLQGSRNPPLNYTSIIPYKLIMFFLVTKNSSLVFLPDCDNTRSLYKMWNDSISLIPTNYTNNITFEAQFVNTVEEMKAVIYSQTSNGYGIYWSNARENTALISPKIETYRQSIGISPDDELFELLYRSIALMNGYPQSSILYINTSYQPFAAADSEMIIDMSIFVAMIVVLPIIISTMPDLQMILEEKDNRIMTLSFLMGCKESHYWFVSFMMQSIMSIFPYLFMSIYFCFGGILKGTSFSLFMTINVLFIISHVWFLLFFTSFMRKASSSRMLVAIFMFIGVFFAYFHFFFTLDDSNHSEFVKHVLSIVPLSCYQLIVMSMYQQSRTSLPPVTWREVLFRKDDHFPLKYQPKLCFIWLFIDILVYFCLFVIFDLFLPRGTGSPPLSIRSLFERKRKNKKKFELNEESASASVVSLLPSSEPHIYEDDRRRYLLKVDGLSKIYSGDRKIVALDDVSFEIEQNEIIVVIGPNGAGKSTLINILAGSIEASKGFLRICGGQTSTRFADLQSILGCCFQENVLIDLLTVREHFDLFGSFRGVEIDDLNEYVSFYSEILKLNDVLNSRASDLSGGQKRKLCVALSLIGEPKLVIMDEPTAGVDVQSRQLIWKTISSLKKTTTIVTSHALEEAEAVSSRLFVVSKGKIPFVGSATELRKRFKCGYVLRIEGNVQNVLDLARRCDTNAVLSSDRSDTIELPVSENVANFMQLLDEKKMELEVSSFSFAVEQLEDVLLKIIQNDEAGFDNVNSMAES